MKNIIIMFLSVLLVLSIGFNLELNKRKNYYKHIFPMQLAIGLSNYKKAETALQKGNKEQANLFAGMGFSDLQNAAGFLNTDNKKNKPDQNIIKLNQFLMKSITNATNGTYDAKRIEADKHIYDVISNTFKSFMSNPNSVNASQLNKDFQKVFSAINSDKTLDSISIPN
jgi:hypothetical protein